MVIMAPWTVRVIIKFPLDARTFPFQRYARSSRHPQKCARFRRAPNRYHKVRTVRYVCGAINVLLLPFECLYAQLAVSFSECAFIAAFLQRLKMVYPDYINKRILVYYRCKKNCMEIARCLTEKEKGFYTFVAVQRGNAAAMMGTMGGTTPSVDFFS